MPTIRIIFTAILIWWLTASHEIKAAVSTTAARNLDRSNDEVVFHHLQTSRIATHIWHHTTLFVLHHTRTGRGDLQNVPNNSLTTIQLKGSTVALMLSISTGQWSTECQLWSHRGISLRNGTRYQGCHSDNPWPLRRLPKETRSRVMDWWWTV